VFQALSRLFKSSNKKAVETIRGEYDKSLPPLPEDLKQQLHTNTDSADTAIEIVNDDSTPIVFVLQLLEEYFAYSFPQAAKLTRAINEGKTGRVISTDREAAEKVRKIVEAVARERGYPLICKVTTTRK
jgi:ATP-dependent Clp protease adaptor protein ClpS